jgi:hypothetical protein
MPLKVCASMSLMPVTFGADRVLTVGRDSLLHLRHAQARVLPDHHTTGMSISGKMSSGMTVIAVTPRNDEDRQHVEGVWKLQRKANYAHGASSRRSMTLQGAVTRRAPAAVSQRAGASPRMRRAQRSLRATGCAGGQAIAASPRERGNAVDAQSAAIQKASRLSTSREWKNSRWQE